jgi:hypothetical protein
MPEIFNTFIEGIKDNSVDNIEWDKIKDNKKKLLSNITDYKKKDKLLLELNKLEKYFKYNKNEIYNISKVELLELKNIFENNNKLNNKEI